MASPAIAQSLHGGVRHTLGVRPDGTVAVWGYEGYDDLGQVSGANSVNGATSVSGGFFHSLALREDGSVAAWGVDSHGQVAGATGIRDAVAISAAGFQSLALRSDGTVAAWGDDVDGVVSGASSVTGATAIAAGYQHALALRSDGSIASWGSNNFGQVGGASEISSAIAIAAGERHSLALLSDGTVAAWGWDFTGQVSGANSISGAVSVSAGTYHSVALRSNGTVAEWGATGEGNSISNAVFATAGYYHNYFVLSDGTITSTGESYHGQRNTPVGFALPTTVRWTSATNGDYLNSHLWNGRIPSTALSTAVFDKSGTYSIHFGNTARAKGLEVLSGDLTFNLGSHQYQVGGNVNIANGATFTSTGTLIASGQLNNAGTFSVAGATTAQTLDNSGLINVSGLLHTTHGATNQGTIDVNYGSELLVGSATAANDGFAHVSVEKAELEIVAGGTVNSQGFAQIGGGNAASPEGVVTVSGPGSQWTNSFNIEIGVNGDGRLQVLDGGRVVSGAVGDPTRIGDNSNGSMGRVTVSGSGSEWDSSSDLVIEGTSSRLTITDGGVVSNLDARADGAEVLVSGPGSTWNVVGQLRSDTHGELRIEDGGVVNSTNGQVAGLTFVTGHGSRWDVVNHLEVGQPGYVSGGLDVSDGGFVTSQHGSIGTDNEAWAEATIRGSGSEWINSGNLTLGGAGSAYGSLQIRDGGRMDTWNATVNNGQVRVSEADSTWLISNNLSIGDLRYSTLSVNNGGNVIVGNRSTITPNGQVYMNGGRFEFGKMSLASYNQVGRYGGAMAGKVEVSGFHNFATLAPSFSDSPTDLHQVQLSNSGTLAGSGFVDVGLDNQSTGHVRLAGNDWMRFGGAESRNAGRITNLGGTVEFGGSLTNQASGFITGRGTFIAQRLDNHGSIAVSGTSDFIGDVNNFHGALIVTSANATTTFYDRVVNNGEIRTSSNGNTVFFEDISGAGSFTGTGSVFFEGNVNPGNSPGLVNFEGNLTLGSDSHTLIELGGLNAGASDQFKVAGDFNILGSLSVAMWDNFELGSNMSFLIADIGGNRLGMFQGLGEGDLVGQFSGQNLFITYSAGSGNDIALFTAVPEPSSFLLCLLATLGLVASRRRTVRI